MSYMFILDKRKCVGCSACAVACMDQNDIDVAAGDRPFRQCFTLESGPNPEDKMTFMSLACMHCEDAPCIQSCPSGCLKKDPETGFTIYDNTNCIGCHSCAMACPFAAPTYNKEGKMEKCDGCLTRVKHGLEPACVRVCPFGALQLVEKEEYENTLRKKAAELIAYSSLKD